MANLYLTGNFAPVAEEVTVTDLVVDGQIPHQLAGRFLRIGPNPVTAPDPENHHWFVGDGMVHGVELRDGQAHWYRNRWVRTDTVAEALGEPASTGPVGKMFDSSNTNVVGFDGRIFSLTEMAVPYELSRELDTIGRTDFGGPLENGFTAHPKYDPRTGELHAIGYGIEPPYLLYYVISPDGAVASAEPVTIGGPASIHDFAITETHAVFLDMPVTFSMDLVMAGRRFPYQWDPDYGARVGVMPRGGTDADVRWFEVELGYVFHTMNAYDVVGADGSVEQIVLDVVRYDHVFRDDLNGPGDVPGTLDRWTIDLVGGKVGEERIDERAQEFPSADARLVGRPYRYGYAQGLQAERESSPAHRAGAFAGSCLLKHDLHAGTTEEHHLGAGQMGSEPTFIAASAAAGEDEGWLISYVYDATRGASDLLVLDAHDFGAPVARVELPVRVPFGFHGNWIADSG